MIQYLTSLQIVGSRRVARILSILSVALLMFIVSAGMVFAASSTNGLTKKDGKQLVVQGVAMYEQKELIGAQKALELAEPLVPDNYAVPYYLGLIHLDYGQRAEAISQWQKYLRLDPNSENANHIRKLLTLLLSAEATEKAKIALAREATLSGGKADDNSLVITDYQNLGSAQLNPLGKGMAAMMISDLAKVPNLQVVDRIELQALIQEMKLGASELVNEKTAPRLGRMLKVKRVNAGSFADIEKKKLQIVAVTYDAEIKKALDDLDVQGSLDEFYKLEKRIACGIMASIGKACDTAPKGFHKVHTKSLPAFVAYSKGLDYFDRKQYDDARKQFQKALEDDPGFDLAREALVATPIAAMLVWDTTQIISSASASGIPSAAAGSATAGTVAAGSAAPGSATAGTVAAGSVAAGSATAGTVTAGSAAAGSATAGTVTADSATPGTAAGSAEVRTPDAGGVSETTLAIAGGALAVAGVAALAAGGGGGGGGAEEPVPNPTPAQTTGVTGDWTGTWRNVDGEGATSGEMSLQLTQNENSNSFSGTVSVSGSECFSSAQINGTVSGNTIAADISYETGTARLEGRFDDASMTGTVNYLSGNCAGNVSDVNFQKLSSADISW